MDPKNPSSLNCELRIIRAKNLDFLTTGSLFVRYCLQNEKSQRIQLNTKEIPTSSTSDPYWNETISLECSAEENIINKLGQQSVTFELRWRSTKRILGKNISGSSKLLGSGEISWMEVLETKELSLEKWVNISMNTNSTFQESKPASLQIEMKITVPIVTVSKNRRNQICLKNSWNECGCRSGGCNCIDEDFLALAALEVF